MGIDAYYRVHVKSIQAGESLPPFLMAGKAFA
jgi:hypothetical protein